MSALAQARAALTATIGALPGVSVHETLPGKVTPPAVVVLPDSPYIETDPDTLPYGHGWARYELVLIVAKAQNTPQDTALDDLIGSVLEALYAVTGALRWWPLTVDKPSDLPLNETTYLHTRLHVRAPWTMRSTP